MGDADDTFYHRHDAFCFILTGICLEETCSLQDLRLDLKRNIPKSTNSQREKNPEDQRLLHLKIHRNGKAKTIDPNHKFLSSMLVLIRLWSRCFTPLCVLFLMAQIACEFCYELVFGGVLDMQFSVVTVGAWFFVRDKCRFQGHPRFLSMWWTDLDWNVCRFCTQLIMDFTKPTVTY